MDFDPTSDGQTPIDDISGLRDRSLRTQSQLNEAEAENIRTAVIRYLAVRPTRKAAPFDMGWFSKLHAEMFGRVWSWAGVFRKRELNIGSPPHLIGVHLQELVDDLNYWHGAGVPLLEQGVRLHHRSVQVHPFLNGNGRWARMLCNVWLRREGGPMIVWPDTTIGKTSTIRSEYLDALRAADRGDLSILLRLHERYAEAT